MGEFERWLTLPRLASSDFMALVFSGIKCGAWSDSEAADLTRAALRTFGNKCCFYLASVVVSGTPNLLAVGFWRRTVTNAPLVHAVAVDPRTLWAADILGARHVHAVQDELEAVVGPVRMEIHQPIPMHEMSAEEFRRLDFIASGLPWLPSSKREGPNLDEWRHAVMTYASARAHDDAW